MELVHNDIDYQVSEKNGCFNLSTGIKEDFACFVLWEDALPKQEEIVRDLQANFEVIANILVYWTEINYTRNIERLYERYGNSSKFLGIIKKHGKPPFRVIIVKDPCPFYTWKKSVSGNIEPSNERVVDAKRRYRSFFEKPYQVHSSNNIEEFLVQSVLIFGKDYLEKIFASPDLVEGELYKDLEGADGWESWSHLFSVINYCCRYIVLRNFQSLPFELEDADIDFLTDDFQRLASVANIYQDSKREYKGVLKVSSFSVDADIRFIGDNYFSTQWQRSVLDRRVMYNGFWVPAKDDHFFTLLYHCKVHKLSLKNKYFLVLRQLAKDMRFDWFDERQLNNDAEMGKLLGGYYRSNLYYYADPLDVGVGKNKSVVKFLPAVEKTKRNGFDKNLKRFIRLVFLGLKNPHKVPRYILKKIKLYS